MFIGLTLMRPSETNSQAPTSVSWLEPMLSMAMGLLGALLPDMSCSVRMCGECKGWGADAEPPVGPILAGGEGGTSPATAWTVCGRRGEKEENVERWTNKHKKAETSHLHMKLISLDKKHTVQRKGIMESTCLVA